MPNENTETTTVTTHPCLTCGATTEYIYLCEHCSELMLIELCNGGRERGLQP